VIAPAGSTLWLLRHEIRLFWRGLARRRGGNGRVRRIWLTIALPLILMVTAGLPLGFALRRIREVPITPATGLIATAVLAVLFTLMLSQTLGAAITALYERADLDLLFSSPIAPRRVLAVRFLAVSVNAFAIFGMFLAPILLPVAVMGHPAWLAALIVLFCVALAASGVGLLLAAALFRLIGPRRTRTVGQVLAAIIGAAFFLSAQARNILGGAKTASLWAIVMETALDPRFHGVPGLSWPLRALTGEPLPLLAALGLGGGVFLIANQLLGARFAADAAAAAGAGASGAGRRAKAGGRTRFSASAFNATLRKELRLIVRDPALIAQVLLRVLYFIPLGFLILRQAGQAQSIFLPGSAAALSLVAGQIAGSLAWITISAEDAPDLLSCAPTPTRTLRQAKIAAAVLPVAVMLVPVVVPLLVLSPMTALAAAAGSAASIAMAAMMNVWWQRPGKRADFRRRRQSSWLVTVAELVLGLVIAAATGLAAAGLIGWALIPAALAFAGVMMLRRTDDQIAQSLRTAT
jgi:ABC-2 type transport system permease protein